MYTAIIAAALANQYRGPRHARCPQRLAAVLRQALVEAFNEAGEWRGPADTIQRGRLHRCAVCGRVYFPRELVWEEVTPECPNCWTADMLEELA